MSTQHLRVLVCEDVDYIRDNIVTQLRALGADEVFAVPHGGQALTTIRRADLARPFMLAVLDYDTGPGRPTGLDVLAALRGRWPGIPVVIQSGHGPAVERRAIGAGAAWLGKPWSVAGLAAAIEVARDTASVTRV